MTKAELKKVLAKHKKWLDSNGKKGERADLQGADLCDAKLCEAYLCGADLHGAYLCGSDLRKANLHNAELRGADLRGARLRGAALCYADLREVNLCFADLYEADLYGADLRGASLRGADLRGANLDFASWPLWCGSLSPQIDARLAAQLMYHAMRAMRSCSNDEDVAAVLASADNIRLANRFHRIDECNQIEWL